VLFHFKNAWESLGVFLFLCAGDTQKRRRSHPLGTHRFPVRSFLIFTIFYMRARLMWWMYRRSTPHIYRTLTVSCTPKKNSLKQTGSRLHCVICLVWCAFRKSNDTLYVYMVLSTLIIDRNYVFVVVYMCINCAAALCCLLITHATDCSSRRETLLVCDN
jgi:hypothetical protein